MKKTTNSLRIINDDLGLSTSGVNCIPCECGKIYVGQTSRTNEIRCQEHIRHLCHSGIYIADSRVSSYQQQPEDGDTVSPWKVGEFSLWHSCLVKVLLNSVATKASGYVLYRLFCIKCAKLQHVIIQVILKKKFCVHICPNINHYIAINIWIF